MTNENPDKPKALSSIPSACAGIGHKKRKGLTKQGNDETLSDAIIDKDGY